MRDELQARGGMSEAMHITVCICTFKRPQMLVKLLRHLENQETSGRFTFSALVVDNDELRSAESAVGAFAATSRLSVVYRVEEKQSIALARNRAIANAEGDYIAFIDDDEYPSNRWLLALFNTCEENNTVGVLGPVLPYFDPDVPDWVVKGKFFDRPEHSTGLILNWEQTRTGNVLLDRKLFDGHPEPFNPRCVEGSDQEFFKRMMAKGNVFVWCAEAVVYETVPPVRWRRSFLLRRALYRGVFSIRNHGLPIRLAAISAVAVPVFTAALPLAAIGGQASFMKYLYKLSYHAGRLIALAGLDPVDKPYVSE